MSKNLQTAVNTIPISKATTPPNASIPTELLANVLERIKIIDKQNIEQAQYIASFLEKRNYVGLYLECLKPLFEDAQRLLAAVLQEAGNQVKKVPYKEPQFSGDKKYG